MATNYVKASYTEVVDLQTTNGKTSIIGIHTPQGTRPYQRLRGFFTQFRKYRYKGISSLVMVPAANLPVDPLGLTGVVGTTDLMDPRDNLNPILFHGCHGEALNTILDSIYSAEEYTGNDGLPKFHGGYNVSDSASEHMIANSTSDLIGSYYRCLTDVTWKKFGIQSGVKLRGLHPLVHKMARNTPLLPGFASGNLHGYTNNAGEVRPFSKDATNYDLNGAFGPDEYATSLNNSYDDVSTPVGQLPNVSDWQSGGTSADYFGPMYAQEMTNGMARLGWLPTAVMNQTAVTTEMMSIAMLPKLFMGVLVLPPAYNIEQYFRMVIRHEFEFKDFTTSLGNLGFGSRGVANVNTIDNYFNWIDYSSAKEVKELSEAQGIDSAGPTLDMIGGSSEIVSDGVS